MPIWMLSNILPISIKIILSLSFYRSTLFERVDKWNYEPRSTFKHKKHLTTSFTCYFIFSFNLLGKYKKYICLLICIFICLSTLLFVITIIISTFILQSPPPSSFLFALHFSYLFCFLESLAKLSRTYDTLAGKQGSLFFLLHVGSILTYSNLCYYDPVLLQAIKHIFWRRCRGV